MTISTTKSKQKSVHFQEKRMISATKPKQISVHYAAGLMFDIELQEREGFEVKKNDFYNKILAKFSTLSRENKRM